MRGSGFLTSQVDQFLRLGEAFHNRKNWLFFQRCTNRKPQRRTLHRRRMLSPSRRGTFRLPVRSADSHDYVDQLADQKLINSGAITVNGLSSIAVDSNTASSSFVATIQNLSGGKIIT
jgi:hypothetical protein